MKQLVILRCPHCGREGTRIDSPLMLGDIVVLDGYCGICGKNWPLRPNEELDEWTPAESVNSTE